MVTVIMQQVGEGLGRNLCVSNFLLSLGFNSGWLWDTEILGLDSVHKLYSDSMLGCHLFCDWQSCSNT